MSLARALILLCLFQLNSANEQSNDLEEIIITTGLGKIRGTNLTSRLGDKFYAFRGIRYAKPPLKELRFKAPQPIEQWSGIFDATADGPMCPQPTYNLSDVSEDCLRLNIYTRELPTSEKPNVRRPVILYLHPGGFYSVSGQSKNFAGPNSFMDRSIVLVTMNYRLGSLGFLSTGTIEAPGNAGLKDQVMVLNWIQRHVSYFGGDPNSVTLLGYSAGAMSATLHMVSPMSQGLFHKVIAMSGASTAQWSIPEHQLELAKKQARVLQCPNNEIKEMMRCLKKKDALKFGTQLENMFEFGAGNPILLWKPVIEKNFGQQRFLTEDPVRMFQDGRFMKIPVITGITKDEFVGPALNILQNETLKNSMDKDFSKYAPICLLYERGTKRSKNVSDELRRTYLGAGYLHENRSIAGLANLFADGVIGFGVHRFVHLVARHTKTFYYKFTYQGRYSHLYYPENNKPYGVVHHDDLLYLFVAPGVAPMFKKDDPENLTVERMTRMWSSFAQTGNPNKPDDPILKNLRWKPFSYQKQFYLDIGESLEMEQRLYTDRYQVWKQQFPLSWNRQQKELNGAFDAGNYLSGETANDLMYEF